MKVYVSLPITGRNKDDYTAHCERAIERLERLGYDRTITDDGNSTVMYGFPEHKVDFFISVRL